jgi:hypothetical protein
MLTPETIAEYHFRAIQKTVAWARHKSSYYAARLSAFPAEWPRSLDELAQAPLTSPADIVERGHEFLCVPQSEISRVVTLESSDTSGLRKRVFFTAEDQELALDFFAHGVAAMSAVGDRMGLGVGVDCHAHAGYHLREADLHFEIVSPTSDEPLGDGQMREVVFTTLGGVGMPMAISTLDGSTAPAEQADPRDAAMPNSSRASTSASPPTCSNRILLVFGTRGAPLPFIRRIPPMKLSALSQQSPDPSKNFVRSRPFSGARDHPWYIGCLSVTSILLPIFLL